MPKEAAASSRLGSLAAASHAARSSGESFSITSFISNERAIHNPADATRIAFKKLGKDTVITELTIEFDFVCVSKKLGKPTVKWRVPLRFNRRKINSVFKKAHATVWQGEEQ